MDWRGKGSPNTKFGSLKAAEMTTALAVRECNVGPKGIVRVPEKSNIICGIHQAYH